MESGDSKYTGEVRSNPFREIPSVADLCAEVQFRGVAIVEPFLTELIRRELAGARAQIQNGATLDRDDIIEHVIAAALVLQQPRLRRVVNATGIIVHTNLGRAPVSRATADAMAVAAASAVPLEIDAETNRRGGRMGEISALFRLLTGAEAALVVNNCAAAMFLVLSALTSGRDVIVSRGEAIEIGGGFRIPDVLRQSGARLVEVGTTNRTHAQDYALATASETAAYLKVHPSNFRITGFTQSPDVAELTALAKARDLLVLEDLGSGALLDTSQFGLMPERTLREAVESGADLVMASGDKLLGGPQAGIILGRADLVSVVAHHPLARAVRADKVTLAGVATTVRHYLLGDATRHIPVWRMIAGEAKAVETRVCQVTSSLRNYGINASVVETQASIGGGSLPGETLESYAVALQPASSDTPDNLARRLRLGSLHGAAAGVFGRIEAGLVLLDLRTVLPEDDTHVTEAVVAAYR